MISRKICKIGVRFKRLWEYGWVPDNQTYLAKLQLRAGRLKWLGTEIEDARTRLEIVKAILDERTTVSCMQDNGFDVRAVLTVVQPFSDKARKELQTWLVAVCIADG